MHRQCVYSPLSSPLLPSPPLSSLPFPSPPLPSPHHRRKVQELESKFKDAYAQSLSAKDERIQVLEERVEETIRDNTQLRQELAALKKQNDTRKDRKNSTHGSPGMTRVYSPHEAAADTAKLKEKVEVLHQSVRDEDVRMSSNVRGVSAPPPILL